MADTIEKVYCTGDGGNDNLAAALLARGRDNDPATMLAAMNGGMGGGWNNPFAYMMMLGMFRFMYVMAGTDRTATYSVPKSSLRLTAFAIR
jgi:hypothetical protein